jgi:hypothetical protein
MKGHLEVFYPHGRPGRKHDRTRPASLASVWRLPPTTSEPGGGDCGAFTAATSGDERDAALFKPARPGVTW